MWHVRAEIAPAVLLVVDFGGWYKLDAKVSQGNTPNTSHMIQHTQVSLIKDIIVPYTHLLPRLHLLEDKPRSILLYFKGAKHRHRGGLIRQKLWDVLLHEHDVVMEEGFPNATGREQSIKGMRSSEFCLHPAGDTPTSCRLFDAVLSLCIPVIVSDDIELPFEGMLDYSAFAVSVSVSNALQPGWLVGYLRGFSKDRRDGFRRNMAKIQHMFAASSDKTICVYSSSNFSLRAQLSNHDGGISDLSFSSDSHFLCSASDDCTLRIWDLSTYSCVRTLEAHSNYVCCCAFSPQSNVVASGSFDDTVRLWDVESGNCIRVIPAHSDPVTAIDFNPEGSLIVSSSYDGLCRIWDSRTGRCVKTLIDDESPPVSFVRFSPNGKFVLAATLDSTLRLWNFSTGKFLKTYKGHTNSRYAISSTFSVTNGKYIVSGSEDNCVYLWDLQSRKIVQRLEGHKDIVVSVSCHPKLNIIASGAFEKDCTVKIWIQRDEDQMDI